MLPALSLSAEWLTTRAMASAGSRGAEHAIDRDRERLLGSLRTSRAVPPGWSALSTPYVEPSPSSSECTRSTRRARTTGASLRQVHGSAHKNFWRLRDRSRSPCGRTRQNYLLGPRAALSGT